jgi:hypothetical protein
MVFGFLAEAHNLISTVKSPEARQQNVMNTASRNQPDCMIFCCLGRRTARIT